MYGTRRRAVAIALTVFAFTLGLASPAQAAPAAPTTTQDCCPVTAVLVNEADEGQIRVDLTNTGDVQATVTSFIRRPFEGGPYLDFMDPGATASRVYVVGNDRYDVRVTVSGCDTIRFKGRWTAPSSL